MTLHPVTRFRPAAVPLLVALAVLSGSISSEARASETSAKQSKEVLREIDFNINSGSAVKALRQFSSQSGQQLLYSNADLAGVTTNSVRGRYTIDAALEQLLRGTPLVASRDSRNGAVAVGRETPQDPNVSRAIAQASDRPQNPNGKVETDESGEKVIKLDTFEVFGRKTLNMDIQRSRDDAQPYVVFKKDAIQQSGAVSIEEFLKNRLTQNSVAGTAVQRNVVPSTNSSVNLRGLGTNQTLILVDGRRLPSVFVNGIVNQPDLNGIPLAAVERIEVLPTTASGIYGGSATGGVVNIIMRRDYSGAELKLSYENAFETDSSVRRVDFSSGLNLNGGKTNVQVSASVAVQDALWLQDRDYFARGRATMLANNAGNYIAAFGSGLPPLGATTNIRSSDGTSLVLKSGTALGSPITFVPAGYAGPASDQGAALVGSAGRYNLEVARNSNLRVFGAGQMPLLTRSTSRSFGGTLRQEFSPWLSAFADFSTYRNREKESLTQIGLTGFTIAATAPNNPFTKAIQVAVPILDRAATYGNEVRQWRAAVGVIAKLPAGWLAEADYTWSESKVEFNTSSSSAAASPAIFTAIQQAGTVDVLRDPSVHAIDVTDLVDRTPGVVYSRFAGPVTQLDDASLRLGGPLAWKARPTFAAKLSGLLEHRKEDMGEQRVTTLAPGGASVLSTTFLPARDQAVDSAYLELSLPVLSLFESDAKGRSLDLQLAGRYDRYTTHGITSATALDPTTGNPLTPLVRATNKVQSTNPTFAMSFKPWSMVTLRGSYGTGFLPPAVTQLAPNLVSTITVTDPRRGNASTSITSGNYISGGSPNLEPESSKSWSAGAVFQVGERNRARLSLDYTRIRKSDAIATYPGGAQGVVNDEALLPGRVTRGANLPSDLPGWAGPIVSLNNTLLNLSTAEIEAYDVQLDLERGTSSLGRFDFFAAATWQTHFRTQVYDLSPVIENVGAGTGPLKFKANFGVTWTAGQWSFGWATRYFDRYFVNTAHTFDVNQGSALIPGQVYHDVRASWREARRPMASGQPWSRLLTGMEITVGVKNVFDRTPPYVSRLLDAQMYSAYADPRQPTYYVSVKKAL